MMTKTEVELVYIFDELLRDGLKDKPTDVRAIIIKNTIDDFLDSVYNVPWLPLEVCVNDYLTAIDNMSKEALAGPQEKF